jgi:hypothetical protein
VTGELARVERERTIAELRAIVTATDTLTVVRVSPAVTCMRCNGKVAGDLWVDVNILPVRRRTDRLAPSDRYYCNDCATRPDGRYGYTLLDRGGWHSHDCRRCGRRFHVRPRWRGYCTATCADRARSARWRERHLSGPPARSCPCGKPLTGSRSDARYCSNACRQRAYRQRSQR